MTSQRSIGVLLVVGLLAVLAIQILEGHQTPASRARRSTCPSSVHKLASASRTSHSRTKTANSGRGSRSWDPRAPCSCSSARPIGDPTVRRSSSSCRAVSTNSRAKDSGWRSSVTTHQRFLRHSANSAESPSRCCRTPARRRSKHSASSTPSPRRRSVRTRTTWNWRRTSRNTSRPIDQTQEWWEWRFRARSCSTGKAV